jgi:ketosteroid isomerase-like protein
MTAYAPETHRHRVHAHPWLVAVVVLAAALVALGAWVIVDQTRSSSTQDLASAEVAAMLNARLAAMNRFDAEAGAAFYAKDAVMEEHDPIIPGGVLVTEGRDQIFQRLQAAADYGRGEGWRVEPGGVRSQIGDYVVSTEIFRVPGEQPLGQVVVVQKLDEEGKIAHEWAIIDWLQTP